MAEGAGIVSDKSSIEWTDATWNPTRGCSRVSPGCGGPHKEGGCYAEKIAARFSDPGQPFHGFAERTTDGGRWTGKVELVGDKLLDPLRWKKPRRVFVNSMSDLFHENLPDDAIDRVFAVMALCPQHTFQVLTKRAERMREYFAVDERWKCVCSAVPTSFIRWPLPNVWLGVSAERQEEADERIPLLLQTPAAVRFVSAEPLLGSIDIDAVPVTVAPGFFGGALRWHHRGKCHEDEGLSYPTLDWVIVGGESGSEARPFHIEWAESLIAQCRSADCAVFVKQLGACPMSDGYPMHYADRKGGDWNEWPDDLKVREYPHA